MNIVVTGVSAGIGFELVKHYLANPSVNKVVGIARREDRLAELERLATNSGYSGRFVPIAQDLTTASTQMILDHMPRVDVLINNAGLLINVPFAELTDLDFERSYGVNVFGPARLIRLLLPVMGGDSPTHIVNIGSMGGFQGASKFPGLSAYSSSKAALAGLTECLAEEFKELNIKVNCLALGAVQTEMLAQAFPGFTAPVSASEMASYVADFSLNAHYYYNGKVLPVSRSTP